MLPLIPGVGGTTAGVMAREIFARTFNSRSHLGSYLGLTPSAFDSGSSTRCQGISEAGNSWVRRILIEIAWIWRIMLVALARKLAIALWRYVETGQAPEGVLLDAKIVAA